MVFGSTQTMLISKKKTCGQPAAFHSWCHKSDSCLNGSTYSFQPGIFALVLHLSLLCVPAFGMHESETQIQAAIISKYKRLTSSVCSLQCMLLQAKTSLSHVILLKFSSKCDLYCEISSSETLSYASVGIACLL